jgi:thioredoxin-related protein
MRKTVLTICVVGLAAVTLLGGCKRQSNDPDAIGPGSADAGQTAMEFLKENKLLGKPVLIEFGIVTCELSDEGLGTMIDLHDSDVIEGLQYVRVEASDDAKKVEEYYKEKGVKFLVAQDPERKLADAFGATIYPVFLLIDKFGNTRYMSVFPAEIGDWTEMLMAEADDPGPNAPRLGVKEIDGQELLTSTKLPELGGSTQALSEYAGPGGIMLVFADTSCPYSNQAVTELSGVSLTLRKAAQVATVVVNISDSEKSVREYYAKKKLDLPVVYDVGTATRLGWDVHSVPTIILFDAQGRIAYNGPAVWSDVGAAGEMALGLPPGALKFQAKGTKFG